METLEEKTRRPKYYSIFIGLMLTLIIGLKFLYSLNLFQEMSVFINSDSLTYLVKAREIVQGNFEQMKTHAIGWPIILAPFFSLFKYNNNFEYMPLQISLSIIFSLLTVPLVFLIGRFFLKETTAILATTIYALSPHLIMNSIVGLTVPAFIFFCLLSFFLILKNKNPLCLHLAFLSAGIAFWIRTNGLAIFFALLLISLFVLKIKKRQVALASLNFLILFIIYCLQRYFQFGAVFDYGSVSKYFNLDYKTVWVENFPGLSLTHYLKDFGPEGIINFFLLGIKKMLNHFRLLLFPTISFLLPLGIWLTYAKRKLPAFVSLVTFLSINLLLVFIIYPSQGNIRHIYFSLPFFAILALLPLDELKMAEKSKFIFPSLLFIGVLLTTFINTQNYFFYKSQNPPGYMSDMVAEGQFLANTLKGKIAGEPEHLEVFMPDIYYVKNSDNGAMSNGTLTFSNIYAQNLDDFLKDAKKYHFNLVYVREKNASSFFDDVYKNEESYHSKLTKIYDSKQLGLKIFKSKVFAIK